MAGMAATLSVLVRAQGIQEMSRDLRSVDADLRKTATQADKTAKDIEDTGRRGSKSLGLLGKAGAAIGGIAIGAGLAKGMKLATAEFEEARKVGALTESTIKATGGAANVTAKQVGQLSTAISKKAGMDDEAIQSGANLLLTFKNIRNETGKGNDIFNQATAAAVDLSAAGFGSIESASKTMGKALNDPIKGMTALGKSGVTFSEDQKKAIAALMETGKASDRLKAQQIILKEVQSQVGGAAAAQATPMDHLKVTLGNLAEAAGSVLVPALDKGAKFLTYLVGGMIESKGAGGAVISVFKTTGGVIGDVVASVVAVVKWFGEHRTVALALAAAATVLAVAYVASLIPAMVLGTKRIYEQVVAWTALKVAMLSNPVVLIIAGLAALVAGLVIAYRESETFRDVVDAVFSWLKKTASVVFGFLEKLIPDVWEVIKRATAVAWALIKAYLTPLWIAFEVLATRVFPAIADVVGDAWDAIALVTSTVWDAIKTVLATVWNAIKTGASTAWDAIKTAVTSPITAAATALDTAWEAIKTTAGAAWTAIKTAATTAWDAVRDAILTPVRAARDLMVDVLTGIGNRLSSAWDLIRGAASTAWDLIRDTIVAPVRTARDLIQGAISALRDWLSDRWDTITEHARSFRDRFASVFERMGDAVRPVRDLINSLIDAVKDAISWLGKIRVPKISLPDLNPFGGSGNGTTVGPTKTPSGVDGFNPVAAGFGNVVTSGFRPGDDGWHGKNRARDYAGGDMMAFAKYMAATYGPKLLELIYTPLGFGIKNGQKVPMSFFGPAVMADHFDHVHVAMASGGVVQQSGWAVVGERGPELAHFPGGSTVYDAGQTRSAMSGGGGGPTEVVVRFEGLPVELQRLVRVEIEQDGQRTQGTWNAGVRR